jgi:hypothetical protein
METLINTYRNKLERTDNTFVRYLMFRINWNNRLFAIVPNSYLAIDETEIGFGNKIPLWMFGLLY